MTRRITRSQFEIYLKYHLHEDQNLFDRAVGNDRQCY